MQGHKQVQGYDWVKDCKEVWVDTGVQASTRAWLGIGVWADTSGCKDWSGCKDVSWHKSVSGYPLPHNTPTTFYPPKCTISCKYERGKVQKVKVGERTKVVKGVKVSVGVQVGASGCERAQSCTKTQGMSRCKWVQGLKSVQGHKQKQRSKWAQEYQWVLAAITHYHPLLSPPTPQEYEWVQGWKRAKTDESWQKGESGWMGKNRWKLGKLGWKQVKGCKWTQDPLTNRYNTRALTAIYNTPITLYPSHHSYVRGSRLLSYWKNTWLRMIYCLQIIWWEIGNSSRCHGVLHFT